MLGSTIQRELAEFIMRELNDPRLPTIVSITRVKVTDDLEYADVFVSMMGTEGQQTAGLNALRHSAGLMRTKLTKVLSLRQAPFLRFQMDEQLKKELEILNLIEKARAEQEELDRQRAERAAAEATGDVKEIGSQTPADPDSVAKPEKTE